MAEASRDGNRIPILLGGSNADSGATPVRIFADPTTNRLLVDSNASIAGIADGTAFVADSTEGQPILGVYESSVSSVTDGDLGVAGLTASRELKISIENDAVGIGGGTQYATDTVAPDPATGTAILMERDDALSAVTPAEGDWIRLRGDANGALWTVVNGTVTVDGSGVTQPISGTVTANAGTNLNTSALALETGGNLATIAGDTTSIDGKITACNTGAVTISAALPAGTNNIGDVDIASALPAGTNNIGDVDIASALPAGDNNIGNVDLASSIPAGTNNIGDVDIDSIAAGSNLIGDVGIQGRTTGGLSTYYDADLDEAAIAVKASAGTLYAIEAFNTTDAPLYLQLFNVAQGSVTVGTTTPTNQWVIPGNANSDGAGFTFNVPQGVAYGTAITAACSTNSEGNGAPGAGACIVNIHYK